MLLGLLKIPVTHCGCHQLFLEFRVFFKMELGCISENRIVFFIIILGYYFMQLKFEFVD